MAIYLPHGTPMVSGKHLGMAVVLALALAPPIAHSHGGGLDSYGCHNDSKSGGYHCHRGQFTGERFASKAAMQQKSRELESARQATAKPAAPSVEVRLGQLKALREKGLMTEDEYQQKRAEILKDL